MDFKDKSIVITGAGAGVGKFTAREMASRGGLLTVGDLDLGRAEQAVGEIAEAGGTSQAAKADVREYADVKGLIDQATETYGRVDILINNAGTGTMMPFVDIAPEQWNYDLGICLYGVMNGCHCVLPQMIERGSGKIINVCSDAGRVGEPRLSIYSAAKAGVVGFTKAIAKEVGRYNVLVNCVCFSAIKTELFGALYEADPERERKMVKRYPLGRLGTMQEAANTLMLMASDYVTFITGQVLSMNGGYAMVD